MELWSVSSDVTEMPPGFPLLPASVGHAVQTDQRSHDKERDEHWGPFSSTERQRATRGHQEAPQKKGQEDGKPGSFWPEFAL